MRCSNPKLLLLSHFIAIAALGQDIGSLAKEQPFRIQGTLSAGLTYYSASGIESRREPFSWYLSGAPVITIYGISFPFTLTVSEQERRFAQPFNRYGVSPTYKWIKLHAGYRNVKFSDFTLSGITMLGGGVELNPGKLRFGFMMGRINRAIPEGTVTPGGTLNPMYKRTGYSIKVGIGTQNNYFDLIFFKGRDDSASIPKPSLTSRIVPLDNAVLGAKTHFRFFKVLTFDADLAVSALTRDLYSRRFDDTSDAKLVTLNKYSSILKLNASTGLFTAARTSLTYGFKAGNIAARYERVDQDFQTLGAYFFANDNEQWTLAPTFSLFKNKVSVSAAYGKARDNLNGQKYATTLRTIGSFDLGLQLSPKLFVGLNLSNFGTNQRKGIGELYTDDIAISMVNNSYGLSSNYTDLDEHKMQSVYFSSGYQDAIDRNIYTRDLTNVKSLFANLGYTYTLMEKQTSVTLAAMYNQNRMPTQTSTVIGPSASFSTTVFNKSLRPTLSGVYYLRNTDGQSDGHTFSGSASLGYTIGRQTISLSINYLRNKTLISTIPEFTELRSTLTYGYRF